MNEKTMDVYLLGSSLTGEARAHLLNSLAALFKKEVPVIERMLRKSYTLIKANVELNLAERYKQKIKMAGGHCELVAPGTLPEVGLPAISEKPSFSIVEDTSDQLFSAPKNSSMELVDSFQNPVYKFKRFCPQCGVGLTLKQTRCLKCGALAEISTSKASRYMVMVMIVIGGLVGLIVVLGMVAAIALPAYQDYTYKSKVFSSLSEVETIKVKVEDFYLKAHEFPSDGVLIGVSEESNSAAIESIKIKEGGAIEVTYKISAREANPTIVWRPSKMQGEAKLRWSCEEGGLPNRYRPKECHLTDESSFRGNTNFNVDEELKEEISKDVITSSGMKKISSLKLPISLTVPSDWHRNDQLVDTALLVVSSKNEKYYAMVLAESKVDLDPSLNLQKYMVLLQKNLERNGKNHEFTAPSYSIENGMPVANFEMMATMGEGAGESVNLGYTIHVVETDEHFYRVLAWTLRSNFKEDKALLEEVARGVEW